MIANWLKVLLFVAGGTTAAAGTVYYTGIYDPWASRNAGSPVASAPDSAASQDVGEIEGGSSAEPQEDATDLPAAGAPDKPSVAALSETDQTAMTRTGDGDNLAIPSFHVVRVEPNGSMVIAGSAEPNSQIEVVAGAHVIARADVGSGGDFAAVLDESLDPGDYQIVLRSTGPAEGAVTTSMETAIVSVPDDASGQVLALVEEPGAASRLISVPQAGEMQGDAAANDEAGREVAAANGGGKPADADAGDVSEGESAVGEDRSGPETETGAGAQNVTATETGPGDETPARPATPRSALAVEAIEIEGRSVFVAGRGAAGTTVRVYANDMLLGEAQVSDAGRFLIETQKDLPVGDYIVRADVIGPGGEVTARAAVPFQREAGETIAAVAPREPAADASGLEDEQQDTGSAGHSQSPASGSAPSQDEARAGTASQTEAGSVRPAPAMEADSAAADETMSPALQSVDGSVIIRRGDTLWRISRRVYGRGVRYSTIYLANQDQIRDPDMIWPGQIFAVPEETAEGERADMSTVSDQLAPETTTE